MNIVIDKMRIIVFHYVLLLFGLSTSFHLTSLDLSFGNITLTCAVRNNK